MDRLDAAVEDRQIHPAIVSAKADAPHDRRNPGGAIVEFRSLPWWRPHCAVASLHGRRDILPGDKIVDAGLDAFRHLVGLIEALGKIIIAYENVARNIEQPAIKLHAVERMPAQIDVAPAVAAGDIVVGLVAHAFAHRVLMHRKVIRAHEGPPLDHLLAAITAPHPRRIADAQAHLAAGPMKSLP